MVEITQFTVTVTYEGGRKEFWVNGVLVQVLYPPKEGGDVVNWLPRKGMKVVLSYQPDMVPYTLARRLGAYAPDRRNELWEARRPAGTRCLVAAGTFWVRWEGRR